MYICFGTSPSSKYETVLGVIFHGETLGCQLFILLRDNTLKCCISLAHWIYTQGQPFVYYFMKHLREVLFGMLRNNRMLK